MYPYANAGSLTVGRGKVNYRCRGDIRILDCLWQVSNQKSNRGKEYNSIEQYICHISRRATYGAAAENVE